MDSELDRRKREEDERREKAGLDPETERERREREDREKEDRERAEREGKQREETRAARNQMAAQKMESQDEAEPGDVYTSIQQLTLIEKQLHADANLALSHLAKAVLIGLKWKLKPEAADEFVLHTHGRNIIPGMKTHIPVMADVPQEIHATRRDVPVEQWEIDEARERDEAASRGEDPEALRQQQRERRAAASTPSKPETPGKPAGTPGRPSEPGRPSDTPGSRPEHQPNPPAPVPARDDDEDERQRQRRRASDIDQPSA